MLDACLAHTLRVTGSAFGQYSTRQSLQIKYSTASASDAVTTNAGACTPHPAATTVGAGATGAGAVIPPVIPSGEAREDCHGRFRAAHTCVKMATSGVHDYASQPTLRLMPFVTITPLRFIPKEEERRAIS